MSQYIKLPKLKIKIKDVFSLGDLIKNLTEWFKEHGYVGIDGSDDDHSQEALYTHKLMGGGAVLDIVMWWRLHKYPLGSNKDNAYVRYLINIDLHFLGDAGEVEVMHKGKKVKLNKGEIEAEIEPVVEIDFRNEWQKKGMLKLVQDIFKKKIYKEELESHKKYMYLEGFKMQNVFKQFFNVPTFMPEETLSQPPKGLI